ncbi:membrane-associated guanylate kinase, WW and PDZ domain-containing protein 1b isoform X1, partial [Tachysurus ichikawai]
MSRAGQKKPHWSASVSECAVRRDARGDVNVPLQGGAENGEFVYVGRVDPGSISYNHGTLTEGELVLEVETLPVSGLPLYDVLSAVKNSKGPVRLKTVRQDFPLITWFKLWSRLVAEGLRPFGSVSLHHFRQYQEQSQPTSSVCY